MPEIEPSEALSEHEAAARISELIRPPAETTPKGPDGRFQPRKPPEPEEAEPETDEQPIAQAEPDDGDLGDEDIEIDTGDEAEPAQAPSLDMPASWGKNAADLWQSLSPEQQQFLHQHESKRTSGLSRQANELRAEQEKVKAEAARIEQERLQLARAAQRYQSEAVKRFQAEFSDVTDVSKLAAEDPARFLKWQAAYMAANAAVQESQQWSEAIDADRVKQIQDFRQAENEKVAERFQIDTPEKAAQFEERITKFVTPLGIEPQRLAQYTAEEIALVEDARKWRSAVAKKQQIAAKPAQPPKVIKPGAPSSGAELRNQTEQQSYQKLKKTGSEKDAFAVIKARMAAPRR